MMKNKSLQSSFLLLLTAFIWGMGFVSQRFGMELVGPFFFGGMRVMFAALTILLVVVVTDAAARRRGTDAAARSKTGGLRGANGDPAGGGRGWRDPYILRGGIACGLVLTLGQALQQVGIVYTTASKAGFLTALYIVVVPLLGIFLKKHTHWNTWVSVAVAVVGLYFLSVTAQLTIQPGDLIILISSLGWACHILVIDHYVPSLSQGDVLKLVTIQFAVCSAVTFACAPFLDAVFVPAPLTAEAALKALPAMLYAGCVSAGVGYTLQAIGQRNVKPATAGLIMSLESVFGALGGALLLGERLSPRELLGCALMFGAVVLAQIPVRERSAENGGGAP
jgi:drug/metabolite transporter (DMT)-like permease